MWGEAPFSHMPVTGRALQGWSFTPSPREDPDLESGPPGFASQLHSLKWRLKEPPHGMVGGKQASPGCYLRSKRWAVLRAKDNTEIPLFSKSIPKTTKCHFGSHAARS